MSDEHVDLATDVATSDSSVRKDAETTTSTQSTPIKPEQHIPKPAQAAPEAAKTLIALPLKENRPDKLISSEKIMAKHSELSDEEKKAHFVFCQEEIDCCRDMVTLFGESLEMFEESVADLQRYGGIFDADVAVDYTLGASRQVAEHILVVLDKMQKLEVLDLDELKFINDKYKKLFVAYHGIHEKGHHLCSYRVEY